MTRNIVLRKVEDGDLDTLFEQQRDPTANYMAAFTAKDPSDREAFAAHFNKIRADPRVIMRTILFHGRVAGSIAVWVDANWLGKPEVAYWLGKEYWGKGLATEALSEFLRQVTTRPLYARAAKDNIASLRVLEKCGFKIFGGDKGFSNARGVDVEELHFGLGTNESDETQR